ncbi:FkbM family methyltransferase [Polaromonas sp. P1(28)-8]|nr:FkbM family methyltransferase [Polaromonas sp. P1(28)-8]
MSEAKHVKQDPVYYSQFGEDKILSEIFSQVDKGLCIEVGANDGVNDSTSMFFEKLGWSCILIEPNPVLCQSIRNSRKAKLVELAASDREGEAILHVASGAERAHGVSTISSEQEALEKIRSYGFTYEDVKVKTQTLDKMLDDLKIDGVIHFISIDVEGHEVAVLNGFSIEKWRPTIIILEDNSNFEDIRVCNYLKKFGYIRFMRTGVNDWYAHGGNKALATLRSRIKYNLTSIRERVKSRIKRIPGVMAFKKVILN